MTKAQRAKKKIEDRENLRKMILIYAIGLLSLVSVFNNYKQAEDIAELKTDVYELQREIEAAYTIRSEYYVTKPQLNSKLDELMIINFNQNLNIANMSEILQDILSPQPNKPEEPPINL